MENATKALLIAAAVLIAILIISFALIIYNMASETVGNVNLSEAEITQFNSRFTTYEGSSVSGSQVNALLNTVLTHNQQEEESGSKRYVTVKVKNGDDVISEIKVDLTKTPNVTSTSITKVPTGNNYKVVVSEYSKGLVKSIEVTKK